MTNRPIDRQAARPAMHGGACARSIVIGTCLALTGVMGGGCVVTPRQAGSGAGPLPPQVPESATGAAAVSQDQRDAPKSEFRETATDRQKFQVHIDFGRVFETQENFDAAVLEYQDALTVLENPKRGTFQPADEALAQRGMGGALDRLGRFAQAEVHYKKALKLSPKDPKIWNDAGYSYYLQGRWADAEFALRTAGNLAPDDERIRTNLGLTLAAAGKPDQAFPLLSESNGDAAGHANLGYLLAATGQFDLARRQYETALALRPNLELARRALARLDRQQDGVQQASKAPEQIAQVARTIATPVDASVNQASTSRPTLPLPQPRQVPPARTVTAPIDAGVDRASMSRPTLPLPQPRQVPPARTVTAPIDAGVDQASMSRPTLPLPQPRQVPPAQIVAAPTDAAVARASASRPTLPLPQPRQVPPARTVAAPVDAGVDQASASRPKIPPPRPSRIPPAERSPHPVDPEASRAVPPSTVDSSNLSPPAPR